MPIACATWCESWGHCDPLPTVSTTLNLQRNYKMITKRKAPPHAFKPGTSGNPAGRPAGSRGKAVNMLLALMDTDAPAITRAVIDAAKGGDLMAAKIIERMEVPIAANRPKAMAIGAPHSKATLKSRRW